jgi:hypothetical protein
MAIKVRSNQIELADTFDFAPSGSVLVATPTSDNQAANKAYVDSQLPDSFAGGDGISITDGEGTDTIAVDLATTPALEFSSAKLQVKLKAETGGSISKDANGLYIADSAIGNAKLAGSIANDKLANSTISGIALGSNLNSLAAGNGISMTSYNGSAAVSDLTIDLDGSSLAVGASGLKIADDGVGAAQIADGAIDANAKLADAVITGPKLAVQPYREKFTGDGSTTAFTVSSKNIYTGGEDGLLVFRNGLLMEGVASSPAGQDQYTAANSGANLVITFGSAPSTGDTIFFVGVLVS